MLSMEEKCRAWLIFKGFRNSRYSWFFSVKNETIYTNPAFYNIKKILTCRYK